MKNDLEKSFDSDMRKIYRRALYEVGYPATRFLTMLRNRGGLKTAHILINKSSVLYGYNKLKHYGRLDLTVEALIFDNHKYYKLFTEKEISIIKNRLNNDNYGPALK